MELVPTSHPPLSDIRIDGAPPVRPAGDHIDPPPPAQRPRRNPVAERPFDDITASPPVTMSPVVTDPGTSGVNPSSTSNSWSEEETARLLHAISHHGTSSWAPVAQYVGRTNKACFGRWRSITTTKDHILRKRREDAANMYRSRIANLYGGATASPPPVGVGVSIGVGVVDGVGGGCSLATQGIIRAVASPGAPRIPNERKFRPSTGKWDATKLEALTEGIRAHGSGWQHVAHTSVQAQTPDELKTITPLLDMYRKSQLCLKDKFKGIKTTLRKIDEDDGVTSSVAPEVVAPYRRVADAVEEFLRGKEPTVMSQEEIQAHVHDMLTYDHHPHHQQPQMYVPQAVLHSPGASPGAPGVVNGPGAGTSGALSPVSSPVPPVMSHLGSPSPMTPTSGIPDGAARATLTGLGTPAYDDAAISGSGLPSPGLAEASGGTANARSGISQPQNMIPSTSTAVLSSPAATAVPSVGCAVPPAGT